MLFKISRSFIWTLIRVAGMLPCIEMTGCGEQTYPPAKMTQQALTGPVASAIISSQTQTLTPDQISTLLGTSAEHAYHLGPNDVISVSVYNHPELSAPPPGMTTVSGGILISSDGSIDLPLIGAVNVNGLTASQAQHVIASDYASFVQQPNVTVQVVDPQSLRYYLLGEFTSPGVKYPGREMTLLEALSLGGSVNIGNADLYQAYVAKDNVKLPIDLHSLLVEGDLAQNILLSSDDVVVIPPSTDENAFVFGSVGKPGAIPFQSGALSLLQALSVADLDLPNYTQARLSQIHLIRARGDSADFMVLDARKVLNGTAPDFPLEPGDILFVPPTDVATWNQVLTLLLPSLTTISDLLNPFVSIKYLSQKN